MERTDQWGNKTAGSMTSHATCTRQLDNGENRLEGKLDSLVNDACTVDCGESCNFWFVWHDILID